MSIRELKEHLQAGEAINLLTLKEHMPVGETMALAKTKSMEIIRMVLPGGKKIAEHKVSGEITVQCLKGEVDFGVEGKKQNLKVGDLIFLNGGQKHDLLAISDSVLLVTILLN